MSEWTDRAVRAALGWGDGRDDLRYERIVTDSRTIGTGDLFVALEGERFDGHHFLADVQRAGATGAVVRAGTPPVAGLRYYPVDDPLRAYGWLARARRRRIRGPVVAITGTNGKTSTKELLRAVLGTRDRVSATRANLNNLVGVPQTILEAPAEADALVIEAGANLVGEIARYRDIVEPTITVVTNVAAGHLEGFGSLEGVLAEKLALVDGVALAVVGTEPPALATAARLRAHRVITAGLERADVMPGAAIGLPDGRTELEIDGHRFTLPLIGRHQAANAMLAWAVGRELGLDLPAMAAALGRVAIPGGRGELAHHRRLTVLNDCYNANPASFQAAIDTAATLRAGRRLVFVAGTMRELGPDAARFHAEIAKRLVELDPDLLAAVGEFVPALEPYRAALGDRLVTAPDAAAIGPLVAARLDGTELVVLKASRGVALERILPDLLARTSHEAHA
jgi:UDP-N-acetylmuramoyl-tripeptide--D-alanyl-D-alanine ligase